MAEACHAIIRSVGEDLLAGIASEPMQPFITFSAEYPNNWA
jgi:hypothetical protein